MINSPVVDTSKCVKCGRCKSICPIYAETIEESMSARGRAVLINAYNSQAIQNTHLFRQKIYSCLLCGACLSKCPLCIDIAEAVYKVRENLSSHTSIKYLIKNIIKIGFKNPTTLSFMFHIFQALHFIAHKLPYGILKKIADYHIKFPLSTFKSGSTIYRTRHFKGRLALFLGCTSNFIYPHIAKAFVRVANRIGYDVVIVKAEQCCGAPLLSEGLFNEFKNTAIKNISLFNKLNATSIVSLCPTCVHFLKDKYAKLIGESIINARDAISLLYDELLPLSAQNRISIKLSDVILHQSCHTKYYTKTAHQHITLLNLLGLRDIRETKGCCGFGGTFCIRFDEYSNNIFIKRAQEITGTKTLITTCPNCMIRFSSLQNEITIKHTVELIDEAMMNIDTIKITE